MKTEKITLSSGHIVEIPLYEKTDFYTDLINGYYNNQHVPKGLIKFPSKYDLKKELIQNIEKSFVGTLAEINAEKLKVDELVKPIYEAAKKDYETIYPDRYQEFKNDLLDYYGVTNNPKALKAFSIAYDKQNSSGYSDIASFFADIVELIID